MEKVGVTYTGILMVLSCLEDEVWAQEESGMAKTEWNLREVKVGGWIERWYCSP